jgi:hypothetical protein
VLESPPALLVEAAGEGVHDAVDVRRDVQAGVLDVVRSVDDAAEALGPAEAGQESCGPESAAENGNRLR